ncbi:hypothetical protein M911_01360 [Ectothiorhodospira haloalkaliphila]|uniref:YcgL domain-containing protein M911_01360 n=1 Tax=Ectothiorhodospira haloalkaliphila TaxID=421628 RepID=W8KE85_9GAMM|nr:MULTISPECIES: YcgL domain-containing protein [Ectothiorhodospira]AHK78074.1 hypothetical protein M911_01360 [Ectothiorhodospira haloalkaliphila]MCG5494358.1 YcgL domain-containing protein [Ectothiorhodospira variabilis]MCG5496522.1 YcgL domain-containing protein [Ectothiorhodospira variabilis]MCG5504125.1 YcgL domain-containing protein [Ectothiorhodospira variabilis]MCG5507280.1 YcgL domain-containing protein [Ectothiorhodospira variabilis]
MQCYVYRSSRRQDTYVYLPAKDDFSNIPQALLNVFGTPEFALEFVLSPDRRLAREDPSQVLANLKNQGFHLQMPPENDRPA